MSGTRSEVLAQTSEPEERLEGLEYEPSPDLSFDSRGKGYVSFQEFEDGGGMFSNPETDLQYFDSVAEDNLFVSAPDSARLLENYFGQLSLKDELDEYLEYIDSAVLEDEEVDSLDGALVLDLDLIEYDGRQHIYRHEGEVAEEVVEYLAEESSWSDSVYLMEDEEMLFIRSNQ